MPVPSTIADLTTSEATNSPADSETITATTRPSDYLRAHAAIIKTLAGSVTTDIAAAVSAHAGAADPHTGYALESALGTASTKNTGTTSGTVPLVGTKSATESLAGLVELAIQAEAEAGTDDTVVMTPLKSAQHLQSKNLIAGTYANAAGVSTVDFTGIPSWVKRITVTLNGISQGGTNDILIQLGDAGGIETSGYTGSATGAASTVASTLFSAGFILDSSASAATVINGSVTLSKLTGNTWTCSGVLGRSNTACTNLLAGVKTLSDTLTTVRLAVQTSGTFDAGDCNILYE